MRCCFLFCAVELLPPRVVHPQRMQKESKPLFKKVYRHCEEANEILLKDEAVDLGIVS